MLQQYYSCITFTLKVLHFEEKMYKIKNEVEVCNQGVKNVKKLRSICRE